MSFDTKKNRLLILKVNIIKSQNIHYPSTKQCFYYQAILGKESTHFPNIEVRKALQMCSLNI